MTYGSEARERVTLIVFPGGFNWPVWVAQELGFFTRQGVDVAIDETPGSVFQWTALAHDRAQIAITLMDNVVAYREGQGAPGILVEDAVAVMGLDVRSMPTLLTQPAIRRYEQLRGATLAVDALETGNALVLQGLLEHGGLAPGTYTLARAGGVAQRFEAMRRGDYAGSLFNAPLDALLEREGFRALDRAGAILPRFQGHVVAVRRRWASTHRHALVGVLRALCHALDWLYEPANRAAAFALYNRHLPAATPGADAAAYAVLFDEATGFPRDGGVDLAGVEAVLRLRARYGRPAKPLRHASDYHDATFLAAAHVAA